MTRPASCCLEHRRRLAAHQAGRQAGRPNPRQCLRRHVTTRVHTSHMMKASWQLTAGSTHLRSSGCSRALRSCQLAIGWTASPAATCTAQQGTSRQPSRFSTMPRQAGSSSNCTALLLQPWSMELAAAWRWKQACLTRLFQQRSAAAVPADLAQLQQAHAEPFCQAAAQGICQGAQWGCPGGLIPDGLRHSMTQHSSQAGGHTVGVGRPEVLARGR